MDSWIKKTELYKTYIEYVLKIAPNMITNEIDYEINEDLFKLIYLKLQEIKDDLNFPLNDSGLIFRTPEEFDLDKISKEIALGG